MISKARNIKERACALVLALILALSGILPEVSLTAKAANGDPIEVVFIVSEGSTGIEGATVTVGSSTAQTDAGGICEITGLIEGSNYSYTVTKDYYGTESGQFTASTSSVSVKMNKEVTGISLNPTSSTTIGIGGICTIEALTAPTAGKSCTWISSQPGVASVENGVVTGISAGSTTITASYGDVTSEPIEVTVTKINTNISLDLQAIPTNKVDAVVKCTVNGLPSDATGSIDFIVNGKKETSVSLPTNSYTISDASGDIKVQAVYSGDNKYYGSSSAIEDAGKFTKSQRIIFEEGQTQEDPKVVTLTTEGTKEFEIRYAEASNVQGDLSYQVKKLNASTGLFDEDSDKVTVNDNTVTAEESGFYKIIVTAAAKDDYNEASADYYVYVQDRIDFSELPLSQDLNTGSKVYNGDNQVELMVTLSETELKKLNIYTGSLDTSNGLTFVVSGETSSADANTYNEISNITVKSALIGIEPLAVEADVDATDVLAGLNIEITKREVLIGTEGVEVTNSNESTTRALVEAIEEKATDVSTEENTGFLESEADLVKGIKITTQQDFYYEEDNDTVNMHQVIPALENLSEDYRNYSLKQAASEYLGNVKVTNMTLSIEDILANVTLSAEKIYITKEENPAKTNIWIGTGRITLTAEVTPNKYFDTVCFVGENDISASASEKTYTKEYAESGKQSVYVYLKKDGKICSQLNNLAKLTYYVDGDVPEVGIADDTHSTISKLDSVLSTITFGLYNNEKTVLPVTVTDKPDKNSSGLASWSYAIYRPEEKNSEGEYEVTEEKIKDLYESNSLAFTPIDVSKSSFEVPVDYEEGHAVVLIYVADNIGNTAIYASNGIVMEVEKPTIKITDALGNALESNIPYNSDVEYKVTVNDFTETEEKDDLEKVVISGIKEYTVTVYDGTDIISETESAVSVADADSYYKLSDLRELKDVYEGTIAQESNNLRIEVTAIDQAGNEIPEVASLMIDKTAPEITTSLASEASAQNEKYYNKKVTTIIEYKEKNFDQAGMTFDIYLENESYTGYTLAQLKALTYKDGDEERALFTCEEIIDSESDKDVSTYSNDRVNTLKITAEKEEEYRIVPHFVDCGGLTNKESDEAVEQIFVYDATAPVIAVSFTSKEDAEFIPGSAEENRVYTQENVTANVMITEKNFCKITENDNGKNIYDFVDGQMNFDATKGTEYQGNVVDDADADAYKEIAEGTWDQNANEYSNSSFRFSKDANYTFGFTYTDLAGNSSQYEPVYFTVDDTVPTGEIQIRDTLWGTFLKAVSFGFFTNSEEKVTLTSNDITAGVESVKYYKYIPDVESRNYFDALTIEDLDNLDASGKMQAVNQENLAKYSLLLQDEEQVIIYTKIVDKAGNVTYINSHEGVIVDKTKPEAPQITITTAEPAQGIFNGNVDFTISVKDPESGGTYSGLKEVKYEVRNNGTVTQSGSYLSTKKERRQTIKRSETVNAQMNNSNFVTIWVQAEDYAGNISEQSKDIKIDITAPVIENITWNTSAASNGKYYNVTRVATITVRERNFDPNQVRLNITNTDGTPAQVSGWTVDTSGTSDENKNTCTVTFAADGDYNMNVSCTDKAGWNSNTQTVEEFTIDKTAPTINVAFDNNNVKNGKYYNTSRTATITVNEHNFRGSDVLTAISSNTSTPGVYGWNGGGDVHTATVPFTTDGAYSFVVNYTDLAGNPAVAYNVNEFVVDLTKPEIEIFDIVDKSANNGEVAPGVRYSDTNYDVNGVSITYSGPKHEEKAVDGARSSIPNGESIKMADFEHTQETDDVYTMVAKVTDLAGNYDEKQVTFSVNRFGSNFIFSDETAEFLDDYYNNEEENLVVTEINVDTLEHRGITCGHDGDMTEFEEGEDYTVKESGSEVSWKSYKYTINKENFEKEGLYNITIDSVDRATNEVNNKIKEADIEFVIDKTAPTVVITGIEDDGQYRTNERDITIATADNVAMDRVEFYVDDSEKPVESYNAQTILRQKGELPYTLTSSSDWQEIKAVAIDKAGNVTDTSRIEGSDSEKWISVLVTSNVFVQFYRNTPVLIGTIVVLILLFAFLFLVLAKRRKKDEGKTA